MDWNKYPKTKALMDKTGMNLDQVLLFTENELKKIGEENGDKTRDIEKI